MVKRTLGTADPSVLGMPVASCVALEIAIGGFTVRSLRLKIRWNVVLALRRAFRSSCPTLELDA